MSDLSDVRIEETDEQPPSVKPDHKISAEKKFGVFSKPDPIKSSNKKERAAKAKKDAPPRPAAGFTKALEELYVSVGLLVMPFDRTCSTAIIEAAPDCAKALDEISKTNPVVRRIIVAILTTNAWGVVIMAHAPILMTVMSHHVMKNNTEDNGQTDATILDITKMFNNSSENGDSAS